MMTIQPLNVFKKWGVLSETHLNFKQIFVHVKKFFKLYLHLFNIVANVSYTIIIIIILIVIIIFFPVYQKYTQPL